MTKVVTRREEKKRVLVVGGVVLENVVLFSAMQTLELKPAASGVEWSGVE